MANYWQLSHKRNTTGSGNDLITRISPHTEAQVATGLSNDLPLGSKSSVSSSSFEIVPATEIPETALLEFYHQMFPERAAFLANHWRWLVR